MTENKQLHVTLSDGTIVPQLGFGTYKMRGDECYKAVRHAIEVGYRHIDTASLYKNEEEVGRAIADAIKAGDVARDELFITTKLWHDSHGRHEAEQAFQVSKEKLGLDYIDLYLIHWPVPHLGKFVETWEGLINLLGFGTVQTIGVSNFYPEAIDELIAKTGHTPTVNQVELHPGFSQAELRDYHRHHNIATTAWSPIVRGSVFDHPTVEKIAEATGRTPAQIVLRWHMQLGNIAIPKSATPERIAENFSIFDFELTDEQMAAITALDSDDTVTGRFGPDPREFGNDS
ncbi:aldo/keto reductase [Corynebacterium choanae]|uniref:Putative oxidoreductase n=1 Tax=Corynebacterium choanae TaxID=1862358 RepID=A0A3G6J516_9CORY|nr:aldo/keto reductase [Corynebacterium choanae]AZA13039.1 putative oxidoreductase [Corynebacterium choanae]